MPEIAWSIYLLVDPSGEVRYVGKANCPESRLRVHWADRFDGRTHKDRWLSTLSNPPIIRVVEVGTGSWQEAERFYISFYRDEVGCRLTNIQPGGEGGGNFTHHTEATKLKISKSKKNVRLTDQHKHRIGLSILGKKFKSHLEPELISDIRRRYAILGAQARWQTK